MQLLGSGTLCPMERITTIGSAPMASGLILLHEAHVAQTATVIIQSKHSIPTEVTNSQPLRRARGRAVTKKLTPIRSLFPLSAHSQITSKTQSKVDQKVSGQRNARPTGFPVSSASRSTVSGYCVPGGSRIGQAAPSEHEQTAFR
jgi:hypothetical protein